MEELGRAAAVDRGQRNGQGARVETGDGGRGAGDGEPLAVLVVEDEYLIAIDLEEMLSRNGFRVIGPAHSIATALDLLERERPGAALLDVNLRGERVGPVAEALLQRSIPFLLATAYGDEALAGSPVLRNARRLPKPVNEQRLLRALAAETGCQAGSGAKGQP
jgi:two-component system, response regulator PdtaR